MAKKLSDVEKAEKAAQQKRTKEMLKGAISSADIMVDRNMHECLLQVLGENAPFMDHYALRLIVSQRSIAQNQRIATENRIRSHMQAASQQDIMVLLMAAHTYQFLEDNFTKALEIWCDGDPVARYFLQFTGIGATVLARILSFIDVQNLPPTAGALWSYFGLNPQVKWLGSGLCKKIMKRDFDLNADSTKAIDQETVDAVLKRFSRESGVKYENLSKMHENILFYDHRKKCRRDTPTKATPNTVYQTVSRRPWNAEAKKSVHVLVDVLVKNHNKTGDEAFYANLYKWRREMEDERNDSGFYADTAAGLLEARPNVAESTHWKKGRLSPKHIQLRTYRWVKKIFLSHVHYVAHVWRYGQEPPKPFAVAHLGHAHEIKPPAWDDLHAFLQEAAEDIKAKYGADKLPAPDAKANRGPDFYDVADAMADLDELDEAQ